uniref:Uncharacterized protein n=1 Tax=Rhizophora mucronata TaxID=61149 RepID=A0A2P2PH37_RHIMU
MAHFSNYFRCLPCFCILPLYFSSCFLWVKVKSGHILSFLFQIMRVSINKILISRIGRVAG